MGIQAIILLVVFTILVMIFITRPFARKINFTKENNQALSVLLAERDRLLTSLNELDFDFSLGKLPDGDYHLQRIALIHSGALVMEQLDKQKRTTKTIQMSKNDRTTSFTNDEIEELISDRRTARNERASDFCPKCGKAVLGSDRFCPSCGGKLN